MDGAGEVKPEEEDLWAGTQGKLKMARPESVHYAKKAKKVDVKRLKDNIWKGLRIEEKPNLLDKQVGDGSACQGPKDVIADVALQPDMDASDDETSGGLTQEREFSNVIQDLRTNYTNDKMSEISTSFCFICLLHLANEQGLKIEVGNEGKLEALPEADEAQGQRAEAVGDLEALKVWKVSRQRQT